MKYFKPIFCILIILALTLSAASCSPKSLIKDITGGDVDIDKDGNIKINGEDGELEIGKAKWDKSKMHGLEAPKAKLDSYFGTEDSMMYSFSEMEQNDSARYIDKIKESGFTYNSVTLDDYCYTGTNKNGITISLLYDKDSKGGTVSAAKGEVPSADDESAGAVYGGTDKKWDSDEMGGLPDPGVKVLSYTTADGNAYYILETINDYEGYIEEIKAAGYTQDPSQADINGTIMFTAGNSDGDEISFSNSTEGASISFIKYN